MKVERMVTEVVFTEEEKDIFEECEIILKKLLEVELEDEEKYDFQTNCHISEETHTILGNIADYLRCMDF